MVSVVVLVMFTEYSFPDIEKVKFECNKLIVPISAEMYEDKYEGSKRDEDYFEESVFGTKTVAVDCPIEYVSNSNSDKVLKGKDAIEFLAGVTESDINIKDFGTVEIILDDTKYVASYDTSELEKYR